MRGDDAAPKRKRTKESVVEGPPSPQQTQTTNETPDDENGVNRVLGEPSREFRSLGKEATTTEKAQAFYRSKYGETQEGGTVDVVEPSFCDVQERTTHPCHPIKYLCAGCQEIVRALEQAAFVLEYQPVFHFFDEEQLLRMEDYLTGEDRDTMKLPGASSSQQPTQQRFANQRGIPWLKSEHLDATPREATIIDSVYDPKGTYGEQVVVKLSFGPSRNFRWSLRVGEKQNPNYDRLVKHFGDDSDNWKGQIIKLALERDDFTEQEWPTVVGFGEVPAKKGTVKQ